MKKVFLTIIKAYQWIISPILGRHCRFYPSCSEYTGQAIEKYGAWKGLRLGAKRIVRCQPFCEGGADTVK
ncbi:MAG: membrane protein insertion efficiency factor YidD [Patescibacteria group bacterium]